MSDLIDIDDDAIERTLTEQDDEIERLTAECAHRGELLDRHTRKIVRLTALMTKYEANTDSVNAYIEELETRVEKLEYVIQMTHASIYCHDGYRGIGISEEAESLLNEALAATEQEGEGE